MSAPELSRPVKPRALPAEPLTIEANDAERAALADRFAVTAIATLTAAVEFAAEDEAVLASATDKRTSAAVAYRLGVKRRLQTFVGQLRFREYNS